MRALGVDERDEGAAGAEAWLLVDQPDVGDFERLQMPGQFVGRERHVMQAFTALVQELLHGAVRRGWLQQLDGGFARRQDSDAHFLPGYIFCAQILQAERVHPKCLCLINAFDSDADVVDAFDHSAAILLSAPRDFAL